MRPFSSSKHIFIINDNNIQLVNIRDSLHNDLSHTLELDYDRRPKRQTYESYLERFQSRTEMNRD